MDRRRLLRDARRAFNSHLRNYDLADKSLQSIAQKFRVRLNADQIDALRERAEIAILSGGQLDEDCIEALVSAVIASSAPFRERWQLRRIDIRTRADELAPPIARVELQHSIRGKVSDLAEGSGPIQATFKAISHILDVPCRLEEVQVCSQMRYINSGQSFAFAHIIQINESSTFVGQAFGDDLFTACSDAYLDMQSNYWPR